MRPLDLTEPPSVDLPLALPAPPGEPERPGFPLLAVLAPVIGALALWAITGSPFSLVFAVLGPVVAVASVLDAKRQGRARLRRARLERARRLDELRAEIEVRHESERRAAWRRAPSPASLVERAAPPAWQGGALPAIVVGSGPARSAVRVDGTPADADERRLLARAASLEGAPVLADPYGGVGFVGALPLARAAARAALVQCVHHGVPGELALEVPHSADWEWAARLPHSVSGTERLRVLDRADGARTPADHPGVPTTFGQGSVGRSTGGTAVIAIATDAAALPPGLQTIVRVDAPGSALVRRHGGTPPMRVVPALTGAADALAWAEATALVAERAGVATAAADLPARVELGELDQPIVDLASRTSLAVAVGAAGAGPLVIDLVQHGPHALVAGTTGSGKSEFLLAWLTGLARTYRPDRVAFLLVDFKGGAAFEPIRDLPHVTGVVTDLDESEAERAVMSLRAELRHRERVLALAGARDIRSLDAGIELARLVLVVDEFQAMIERFPDLGSVIADIAARGRSLGVHLVLASQRPNGIVREQVTANCAIRVSLRVMQRADSLAVVGTELAAEIAPDTPGRGIVDRGDGCPVPFQSAVADVTALTGARVANAAAPRARRPWLDPLPDLVDRDQLESLVRSAVTDAGGAPVSGGAVARADAFAIGLADEPQHQRRSLASWSPASDGHLLVLGSPGSGRTGALAAAASAVAAMHGIGSVLVLDGARSAVWDALHRVLAAVRSNDRHPRLVVIDDLDVRFRSWPDEYRLAALDAVEALLREGRARGLWLAAAAAQLHGMGSGIRDAFGARLLLHHGTRSDLVQSGGVGELWRADEPPGCGQWRGCRVQVVVAGALWPIAHRDESSLELQRDNVYAVVAAAPGAAAAAIRSAGGHPILIASGADVARRAGSERGDHPGPTVFVGDADAWAANWALVARIREHAVIVVYGGAHEYRALIRHRALPPLLDEGSAQCWASVGGAPAGRFGWPPTLTTESGVAGRSQH